MTTRFSRPLRRYSKICAALAALAGAAALAGWLFHIDVLESIAPELGTMKVNTALCLLFGGASLLLLNAGANAKSRRGLAAVLGLAIVLIAAMTLAARAPGRMSPATAIDLILLGAALAVLGLAAAPGAAQVLAAAALLLSVLFLLGYAFGLSGIYEVLGFSTIAAQTALALTVLAAGVLCARPEQGWVSEIARDTSAARMARRLLAAVFVLLPALAWLHLQGLRNGWYTIEVGVGALAVANMAVIGWVVIWGTRAANRAEEENRRYAERLKILHEVDRGLITHQDLHEIAEAALRPLRELLDVPRAIVNLFDMSTGEVEWLAAIGRQRMRIGGVRYPISLMGNLEGLRRGEAQLVDTTALEASPHRDALLASGVKLYMVVPMSVGAELIGALSFGGESGDFPPERMAIAREVATQLAIAIHQARLRERIALQSTELEARVQQRTAELEAVNKELESFSYTVSHDLRAPLRAIDGFARIFEEDYGRYVDEEGRRLIGVIRDSSRRMGTLIDNLLAFSKLGRQALLPMPVDMTLLAAEAWVELAVDGAVKCTLPALPEARGDRMLLKQVWTNLLSNAVKYSAKRDQPRIEVSGERAGAEVVYCVADNGAGFDMKYYGKLFGVFQRLHADAEYPGNGVGLATVQRIVLRHGGRAWAESELGTGAKFFFSLPA